MSQGSTAGAFVRSLKTHASDAERRKIARYFRSDAEDNRVIGVRMKQVFDLAKQSTDMSLDEVEELLEQPYYEARMGAVSIMDFQARGRSSEEKRRALFELYLRRHDRINNWDLVDRSAKRVVGGYLYEFEQPRDPLYGLARSNDVWARRTAIVATSYFIAKGELDDTYDIAESLLDDDHEMIHKAVGSWVREAGKRDEPRLIRFLDRNAARMPSTMLRYAVEKLTKGEREHYRARRAVG